MNMNTKSIYNILNFFKNNSFLKENITNNIIITKIDIFHKIAEKKFINENSFLFQINERKFVFSYKNPNHNIILHEVTEKLLNEKLNISNDNMNLLELKFEDYLCDTNIDKKYYVCINDNLKLFVFQSYNQKQKFDEFIKKYNIESILFSN